MRQVQGPKDMPWAAAHTGDGGLVMDKVTLIWATKEMVEQAAEAASEFPYDRESYVRFDRDLRTISDRGQILVMFPQGCVPEVVWSYPHEPGRTFPMEIRGFVVGTARVKATPTARAKGTRERVDLIAPVAPWVNGFASLTFLLPADAGWTEGRMIEDDDDDNGELDFALSKEPRLVGGPTAHQLGLLVMAMASLMNEPNIVSTAPVTPARKDTRPGRARELDIRKIALRPMRYERTGDRDPTGRVYTHRWVVKGHWRRQWYATTGKHEPKWIAPYLKGPEGAPLLTAPKVYVWNR